MAHDHHEWRFELFDGKFHTADLRRCDNVTGDANHKERTKTLVEDQFRGHPGIRATEDDGKRFLAGDQLHALDGVQLGEMIASILHESFISVPQSLQCFQRSDHYRSSTARAGRRRDISELFHLRKRVSCEIWPREFLSEKSSVHYPSRWPFRS